MTVYSGPVFEMTANQIGVIADHLSIPMDERNQVRAAKTSRELFS
jgi:glutamate dehydrogenase (NAD(P)+)